MIRHYETVFVFHPEVGEDDRKKQLDGLTEIIKRFKGELIKVDEWGKRRLAYPIQKVREGYYVLMNYALSSEGMKEIERRLKLSEQIIRYQTLRTSEPSEEGKIGDAEKKIEEDGETNKEEERGIANG